MNRKAVGLIAAGLLLTAAPFASAQGFGGSGFGGSWPMSLPSDILRAPAAQPDLEEEAGEQSAPKVHLLLGRRQPARQFVLWSFAGYADRDRPRLFFALSRRSHIRHVPRHHRRRR